MPRGTYLPPTDDQYRELFDRNYTRGTDEECWLWVGRIAEPYGRFAYRGRDYGAHVAAMFLHGIPVPRGAVVMHVCDVPLCVNYVRHLKVGTQADNRRDAAEKGRTANGDRNGMRLHPERSYFHRMMPEERPRGATHGMTKLSDAEVDAIRKGFTSRRGDITRLSNEYGVSRTHILRIIRGFRAQT